MLMGNRELGPHDESKDFTDKLGPLTLWLDFQVGRNWDKVYSDHISNPKACRNFEEI
jgi:hypothetical protein